MQKFHLETNKGLCRKELVISRAIRFLIEQDLYWAVAYDRWVISKAKHVTKVTILLIPKM